MSKTNLLNAINASQTVSQLSDKDLVGECWTRLIQLNCSEFEEVLFSELIERFQRNIGDQTND